jgi:hypothetical protein
MGKEEREEYDRKKSPPDLIEALKHAWPDRNLIDLALSSFLNPWNRINARNCS